MIAAARHNLATDNMRRWWCRKYKLPPTDPRYLAYTQEQLFVEFLEDALEKGVAKPGIQKFYLPDGTPVARTGDPVVDHDELESARRAWRAMEDELRRGIVRKHTEVDPDAPEPPSPPMDMEEQLAVLGGFRDD